MEFSPTLMALVGLLLAAWTAAAAVIMGIAIRRTARFESLRKGLRRMNALIEDAPAIPMLVRADGRIEASDRLAAWLGLDSPPGYLSELAGRADRGTEAASGPSGEQGLSPLQLEKLEQAVRQTQKTAAPGWLVLTPPGSRRSLAFRVIAADPAHFPGGSAIVWIFDFTENQRELERWRKRAERAQADFAALVGLIEAAPNPMWFRGKDLQLRLVNRAYVEAVGASNAEQVVAEQMELLEPEEGRGPAQIAAESLGTGEPVERIARATIKGERRAFRVSDLPLGGEGVAGYAIDIEEQAQQQRAFRAFRKAQRAMLDQLSVAVAQFDARGRLVFANQPFHRMFELPIVAVSEGLPFERFLSEAREKNRTPEVRDFPAWKREHCEWFGLAEAIEEAWPLPGGIHLRVVGQPMPDGGLVLIAEDRTEQLALSARQDTLLRTRTAMLDSMFEALAVFSPDGSLQLWNRSFAGTWGIEPGVLDAHPDAPTLLEHIAPNLADRHEAQRIGEVIRAATLDRREENAVVELADGRSLKLAGVALPDGNGLLTVLDISDSQRAERALRERNEALEAADAMKASFLANMSYEFRVPLMSIRGFAELIESGAAGPVPDQVREYVAAILESSERLTEQVENVLDLSQSQAGLLPIASDEIELLPFLTQLVRAREKAVIEAGLSLNLRGDKGLRISGDAARLGRALGNLVDNAIAATGRGGRIRIEAKASDQGKTITIADTGRGMSSEELALVMDRDADGKAGAKGRKRAGLGIALARELIEAHGGKLALESTPGKGTTVTVTLP